MKSRYWIAFSTQYNGTVCKATLMSDSNEQLGEVTVGNDYLETMGMASLRFRLKGLLFSQPDAYDNDFLNEVLNKFIQFIEFRTEFQRRHWSNYE